MGRKLKERWLFRQTWVLKARVMAALWKLCGSLDLREAIVLANLFSFVIFPCPTSTFLKHKPTGRVDQ
jgi:hypothetical protein